MKIQEFLDIYDEIFKVSIKAYPKEWEVENCFNKYKRKILSSNNLTKMILDCIERCGTNKTKEVAKKCLYVPYVLKNNHGFDNLTASIVDEYLC